MEELKKELEKILIPFIKRLLELPMKERRKLLPVLRELQWIKSKFAGFSSETFCSHDRARFLAAVQFVCANKRDMDMAYDINVNLICKLLPLYYPALLTDLINVQQIQVWQKTCIQKEIVQMNPSSPKSHLWKPG